jgi:hypothetical protein
VDHTSPDPFEVPRNYDEFRRSKPLGYVDRRTVVRAGLRPVPGIDPSLAAAAIAYGRYSRRFLLLGPVIVAPLLLWAMSTILHEPRMNDIQVLVSSFLGMVLLGIFLWLRSRRAESTNRDTIRTASNRS